ncbi:MAG: glycosyltransferase family 2 protein [Chloroflexi bacterium]|nr:glycosyltransferase family 2 protein [Chloroflexota bacterium]
MDLSLVIPVYNEAESLRPLWREIGQAVSPLGLEYEIIFVDDGSTDDSWAVIVELAGQDSHVRGIRFRRNFGKAAALTAGFRAARGRYVVTLDADLQDDPAEIPRFLATLEAGWDVVSGWKFPRRDPWTKTVPSRIFNWVTRTLTGVHLHDFNCGFKAYRAEVVREVRIYGMLYRYIAVLAHWRGFRVTEIKVHHRPRKYGTSKFGVGRFAIGFFDLITVLFLTQYTWRPLHLFGSLGLISLVLGTLINGYLTVLWFTGHRPIGNRPLLTLGVLLMIIGVQFISFGLLGEMIAAMAPREDEYAVREEI